MDSRRKLRKSLLPLFVLLACAAWLIVPWKYWFGPSAKPGQNRPRDRAEIARRMLSAGRFDEVLRIGSQVSPDAPEAAEVYALVGQAFLSRGELGNARKALEASLDRKLEQPEALEYLAAIYLASGDAVRGLTLLKLVSELKPEAFRPWLAMGKVRHDMGETAEAARAYEECLKRNPPAEETRQARKGLIRAMMDDNRLADAEPVIAAALHADPQDAELMGLAALSAQAKGNAAEAGELAEKCLAIDPANSDALLALAQVRFLEGDPATAEGLLLRADKARPNQTSVLQLLMQAQSRLGKSEAAAETRNRFRNVTERIDRMDKLSKRISAEPESPQPRYELGMEAIAGNMKVLAEQCFKAALDIDPTFEPARRALEEIAKQPAQDPVPAAPGS
ncbi:tetratricopeptide repeat protein [bacterium]|nr:tetratricopeptide repeat protein [bacterium]